MAWNYYIGTELNCVFVTHYGDFSITEAGEQYKTLIIDPKFRSGLNMIRDCRQIRMPDDYDYQTISREAKEVFSNFDQQLGRSKVALVVGNRNDYTIAHQWVVTGRFSALVERKPFRDMAKAREWLGIPTEYEIKPPS